MNMSSSTNWSVLCIWWVAWRQMMLRIWTGGVRGETRRFEFPDGRLGRYRLNDQLLGSLDSL